jgi:hypothetical protein
MKYGFKQYLSPGEYMEKVFERFMSGDEEEGIEPLSELQAENAAGKHMDKLSADVGKDLLSDESAGRYLMPFYMDALSGNDVHRTGKYNEYDTDNKLSSRGKTRGGYSFIGYDPLLPKEEAIKEMADRLANIRRHGFFNSDMYKVKTSDPVDPNEDLSLDPQRDYGEEHVAAKVNPYEKVGRPAIDVQSILADLPSDTEWTPEEKWFNQVKHMFYSPGFRHKLRNAGFTPGMIEEMRKEMLAHPLVNKIKHKHVGYNLEHFAHQQEAEQMARDYYNSKGSVSDEDEKDIISETAY